MTKIDKEIILKEGAMLYAKSGFEEFSIRRLAENIGITHSVIYHYFKNEETLLREIFIYINHALGIKRASLPHVASASEMLKQRIAFQIDNSQDVVTVLKYYISHRLQFKRTRGGFVPDKSALHIEEVLDLGNKTGEFHITNLHDDAKVITHAINGFLLEYFPHVPKGKEKNDLVERIYRFLIKSLRGGDTK